MRTNRRRLVTIPSVSLATICILAGCGQSPSDPSTLDSPVAAKSKAPEAAQQEQALQLRRSLIEVAFQEIDAEGRVVVGVTNKMSKPIDDVRGGFVVEDTAGNYIASTGFTEGVPGDVFLAAGETKEHRPYNFGGKPELVERIRSAPEQLRFYFEVRDVTYADGTKEPGLQG